MGAGMIESMLEPHMKDHAHAAQSEVIFPFVIYAATYTVSGLVTGYVIIENIVSSIFNYS